MSLTRPNYLASFTEFYDENKLKLKMPNGTNYPLNYRLGKQWANSQLDADSQTFADAIIRHTKYVSFAAFTTKLAAICTSYRTTYSAPPHKGTIFLLIIPFKILKSNTWVSLLVFEHLADIIDDIYYDITDVYNKIQTRNSPLYRKKVRCIICDDCSYTGHQLTYIATLDCTTINFPGKTPPPEPTSPDWLTWHDSNIYAANKFIDAIPIETFSVDLIVPYMSILSQTKLRKIGYVKIPEICVVFPVFGQQIEIDRFSTHAVNEFRRTFQYHKDISAIYFDHKIADAVSTFNKIYLLAPIFNSAVKNRGCGFIENCKRETLPDGFNASDYNLDVEEDIDDACPATFYRSIAYTYGGKPIPPEAYLIDVISTTKKNPVDGS